MKSKEKLRLLLIGHMPTHVSGSAQLFKQLVVALSNNDQVTVRVIDTGRPSHLTLNWIVNLTVAIKVTAAILLHSRWAQVISFHASRPAMILFGPVLFLISRLIRRPLILRLFGGALEKEFQVMSPLTMWVFKKTVLSSDLFLLETKHLVKYFRQHGIRKAEWYPNSRKVLNLPPCKNHASCCCKRFVFLGRVIEDKGIGVILQSIPYLLPGIKVDVFGPLDGCYTAEQLCRQGKGVLKYNGVLSAQEVCDVLYNYDALILPTFFDREGYPGVILEAYCHGIPVIATRWRAIPEIVDNCESGILISPHSAQELAHAMNKLYSDSLLYSRLVHGALNKCLLFSEVFWTARFLDWCFEIADADFRCPLYHE